MRKTGSKKVEELKLAVSMVQNGLGRLKEGKNWITGEFCAKKRTKHSYDALGALRISKQEALGEHPDLALNAFGQTVEAVNKSILLHVKTPSRVKRYRTLFLHGNRVVAFNDHPTTTFKDVKKVLEMSATQLRRNIRSCRLEEATLCA